MSLTVAEGFWVSAAAAISILAGAGGCSSQGPTGPDETVGHNAAGVTGASGPSGASGPECDTEVSGEGVVQSSTITCPYKAAATVQQDWTINGCGEGEWRGGRGFLFYCNGSCTLTPGGALQEGPPPTPEPTCLNPQLGYVDGCPETAPPEDPTMVPTRQGVYHQSGARTLAECQAAMAGDPVAVCNRLWATMASECKALSDASPVVNVEFPEGECCVPN